MNWIDASLAYRFENAQAWRGVYYTQAQALLLPESGSTTLAVGSGQARYAGPDSPLNRAVGLGFAGPVAAAEVASVEEFYQRHNAPPRIDLCPLADVSLLELLRERGYRLERFFNILALPLPLAAAPPPPKGSPPPQIRLQTVGSDEADVWIATVAQGFAGAGPPSAADVRISTPNAHSANATRLLATIDGQPAGGGAMYLHDGVAEFGGASTLVAFRGRGVQTALLHERLRLASAAGCDYAIVITTPGSGSQRNVLRQGFTLAYTKAVMVGGSSS
jgi:hypothetical protein